MSDTQSTQILTSGQLRILKAVATLLENPANKITINTISREVHVTEGAIYRHYKSKEEIFESLISYMESNLIAPLNVVQKQSTDTEKRLHTIFNQYMEFLEGHPGLARLMLGHGADTAPNLAERVMLLNAKMRSQISQILKFGQAQGMLAKGLSPEQGTELFYGFIVGAAMGQAYSFPQIGADARWNVFSYTVFGKSLAG